MPRFVAFLGGINVGSHRVTMDRLRLEFESLGYQEVTTFIASGNVLFSVSDDDDRDHASVIATHLGSALGWVVPTFVRTAPEVVAATDLQPFGTVAAPRTHMIALCASPPGTALDALNNATDQFVAAGSDVHWLIDGGVMDSTITLSKLQRAIGPCTTRNMRSVAKLAALLR